MSVKQPIYIILKLALVGGTLVFFNLKNWFETPYEGVLAWTALVGSLLAFAVTLFMFSSLLVEFYKSIGFSERKDEEEIENAKVLYGELLPVVGLSGILESAIWLSLAWAAFSNGFFIAAGLFTLVVSFAWMFVLECRRVFVVYK